MSGPEAPGPCSLLRRTCWIKVEERKVQAQCPNPPNKWCNSATIQTLPPSRSQILKTAFFIKFTKTLQKMHPNDAPIPIAPHTGESTKVLPCRSCNLWLPLPRTLQGPPGNLIVIHAHMPHYRMTVKNWESTLTAPSGIKNNVVVAVGRQRPTFPRIYQGNVSKEVAIKSLLFRSIQIRWVRAMNTRYEHPCDNRNALSSNI